VTLVLAPNMVFPAFNAALPIHSPSIAALRLDENSNSLIIEQFAFSQYDFVSITKS
jgi:hypothetical protein